MGDVLTMQALGIGEKIKVKILVSSEVNGSGVWRPVRATGGESHGGGGEQIGEVQAFKWHYDKSTCQQIEQIHNFSSSS
jgi:hypothetical protein